MVSNNPFLIMICPLKILPQVKNCKLGLSSNEDFDKVIESSKKVMKNGLKQLH